LIPQVIRAFHLEPETMQAVRSVPTRSGRFGPRKREEDSAHIENIDDPPAKSSTSPSREYPFVDESVTDEALPFIASDLVRSRSGQLIVDGHKKHEPSEDKKLWIVIDNIVYDCSEFALEHPGGESVILSFIGEDCSWQVSDRNRLQRQCQLISLVLAIAWQGCYGAVWSCFTCRTD
jgi:hypothetical protein